MIQVFFFGESTQLRRISFKTSTSALVMAGILKIENAAGEVIAEFASGKWIFWEKLGLNANDTAEV